MRFANIMPRAKPPVKSPRARKRAKKKAPRPRATARAKAVANAIPESAAFAPLSPFFRLGLAVAAIVFVLDQASKYFVLYDLNLIERGRIYVAPFFDLVLAMNRGISYGLFPQDGEVGRWVLFAIKIAASVLFLFWLRRAASVLVALALGLLIGGALGNAVDRAVQGAVVDFVSLHAGGFRWYIFNLADAAIVAGVAGLLYDLAWPKALKSPP